MENKLDDLKGHSASKSKSKKIRNKSCVDEWQVILDPSF